MSLIEAVVDRLPAKLWRPANLYILPGGDWHFCIGSHPRLDRSVRTVEWRGHEIAHGRRELTPTQSDEVGAGEFVRLIGSWGYFPGSG